MNYAIFQFVNQWAGQYGWLDSVMVFFARDLVYVMLAILAVLWISGRSVNQKGVFYACLSAAIAILVAGWIISPIVGHPRPFVEHTVHQLVPHDADPSFPSDHTTFTFAIAFTVWLLLKRRMGAVMIVLACLTGIGRVFVGVHYPADIAGGIILALLSSMAVVKYRGFAEPVAKICIGIYNKLTSRISFLPAGDRAKVQSNDANLS